MSSTVDVLQLLPPRARAVSVAIPAHPAQKQSENYPLPLPRVWLVLECLPPASPAAEEGAEAVQLMNRCSNPHACSETSSTKSSCAGERGFLSGTCHCPQREVSLPLACQRGRLCAQFRRSQLSSCPLLQRPSICARVTWWGARWGPGTLLIAAASHLPGASGKNNSLWQDFCQIRCHVAVFLSQELYWVIFILQQTSSSCRAACRGA